MPTTFLRIFPEIFGARGTPPLWPCGAGVVRVMALRHPGTLGCGLVAPGDVPVMALWPSGTFGCGPVAPTRSSIGLVAHRLRIALSRRPTGPQRRQACPPEN